MTDPPLPPSDDPDAPDPAPRAATPHARPGLPPARSIALVAAGGAVGALVRTAQSAALPPASGQLPWSTLAENVTGALLIGLVAGFVAHQGAPSATKTVLGAGFLGAYTTFSTLIHETWRLIEDRAYLRAMANLASLTLSMPAAAAGWVLAAVP